LKHIYFTVTNDLSYDQRMHRICHSLATNGFKVTLVGRRLKTSIPLQEKTFEQKRLNCFFNKGFLFYSEYNLRLFFYLLGKQMDAICAIDLDTILAALFTSRLKSIPRIYDAHEYFTELKEVRTRPRVKWFWSKVEGYSVPRFKHGYTVSEGLAREFKSRYGREYAVVRNLPVLTPLKHEPAPKKYLFYGGAVNEARGLEYLIPAMREVNYKLVVVGDGNFMEQLRVLIQENGVQDKVELKGMLPPVELRQYAEQATLGIALAEKEGINQYHALPNKFLDYIHAALPQVAMNYPEYIKINSVYKVAVLVSELSVVSIANTINETIGNDVLLSKMRQNCFVARGQFNWQEEEKKLINFYHNLFNRE
jgi:glycosyltransferase involved in cell wall biosynthesis